LETRNHFKRGETCKAVRAGNFLIIVKQNNMDFKDEIKQLGERIIKLKEAVQTEEATKQSLILPFIQILGYETEDLQEVVPEYTCDIGTKRNGKIDYAIFHNGKPMLLIECKHWKVDIDIDAVNNRLCHCFASSAAQFGILTNGIRYKFYTDLEEPNRMDEVAFIDVDLTKITDHQIEELQKFKKEYFDVEKIISTVAALKYASVIKEKN
jgi:hypothetical protein